MRCKSSLASFVCLGLVSPAVADYDAVAVLKAQGYQRPPAHIEEAVLAPWHKNIAGGQVSPNGNWMLVTMGDGMPPLAALGNPHINLAGMDMDTVAGRLRSFTTRTSRGFAFMDVKTGKMTPVQLAASDFVSNPSWSPDGTKIAFLKIERNKTLLCVAGLNGSVTSVGPVKATIARPFEWLGDSKRIACLVESTDKPAPGLPGLATGPVMKMSDDKTDALRTYPSLLHTQEEADLYQYYATGQIAIYDIVGKGKPVPFAKATMVSTFDVDPAGTGVVLTETKRPFSFVRPASSFPRSTAILDQTGKVIYMVTEPGANRPPEEDDSDEQRGGGQRGAGTQAPPSDRPRSMAWHPEGGKLLFLQMEPAPKDADGKPIPDAKRKDQLFEWKAPYTDDSKQVIWSSETRIDSVDACSDGKTWLVNQTIGGKRVTSVVRPDQGSAATKILETTADDFYNNPGNFDRVANAGGAQVVRLSPDAGSAYLTGTQYFKDPVKEAPRPFVDKVDLTSGKKTRIWQSSSTMFETADILDASGNQLLVSRESRSVHPQQFFVDLAEKVDRQITQNVDYLPDLTDSVQRTVQVTRADGFKFNVRITLPQHFHGASRLPAFFWFYPSEFENQAAYDRGLRTLNVNTFRRFRPSSVEIFLREGYAVVDPDCPIVGPTTAPNDSYVHQLRMNLSATIDALDAAGYIDRTKLALGGHSYGAFSTANAMVQTPFFKAGIAGDGNYNRTLTPFGFQSEPRMLWQSREMYFDLSAMLHAENMTGALLMYHGMEDQNIGTDPINSERMFATLEALGKPAAMFMYPYEDHGQVAKETRLDMWARWVAWLDRWVKNPEKYQKKAGDPVPPQFMADLSD